MFNPPMKRPMHSLFVAAFFRALRGAKALLRAAWRTKNKPHNQPQLARPLLTPHPLFVIPR